MTLSDDDFEKLPVRLQQAIARGEITLEQLEARIAAEADAPLCASCGKHVVTVRHLGLCRMCHRAALVEAHETAIQEKAAARALDAARQRKHRARVCEVCGEPWYPRVTTVDMVCPRCRYGIRQIGPIT